MARQMTPETAGFQPCAHQCHTKYHRWHNEIISRARVRTLDCYSETHHVVPRSLGGSDHPSNLVQLTYREHFLVHWLLTRLTVGADKRKMVAALHAMTLPLRTNMRAISGWRIDVSKRARKHEIIARRRAAFLAQAENERRLAEIAAARIETNAKAIANFVEPASPPPRRGNDGRFVRRNRRRRPRPGKRLRKALLSQRIIAGL